MHEVFLFFSLLRSYKLIIGYDDDDDPTQFLPQAISQAIKWPGREADHLPPSSVEE
jgi:hypothetical protein